MGGYSRQARDNFVYSSERQPLCFIGNALHCIPNVSNKNPICKRATQVLTCLHIECVTGLAGVWRPNESRDFKFQVVKSDLGHGGGGCDKNERKEQEMTN